MPRILTIGRYVLFFWISDGNEPIHIHIAIRTPTEHATKFWLTEDGGCVLASNGSHFSNKELRAIAKLIRLNHTFICKCWADIFHESTPRFYQ